MKTILAVLLAIFVFCIALPFSLCFAAGPYTPTQIYTPIDTITPGVVDPNASPASICEDGTSAVRHTTAAQKREAYRAYGRVPHQGECAADPRGCEVDHRIPLTCGGADEQANLWPQPYPQASLKDKVEALYWRGICRAHRAGDDAAAQSLIDQCRRGLLGDWRTEYFNLFGEQP
jgi:hypothetical protein